MAKRLEKRNFTTEEARDLCYRRVSDRSDDDESEEDSDTSFDSEAEDMFQEGRDITLDKQSADSDTAWEPVASFPASKRPRRVEQQDSSSGEEPNPPTTQRGPASRRKPRGRGGRGCRGGRGRARGRSGSSQSQAGVSAIPSGERWNDVGDADVTPPQPTFRPKRQTGPLLISTETYTVLQLFRFYFTNTILLNVIRNTNDFGSKNYSTPTKPWVTVTIEDMFSFMSMVIYMGIVKCCGLNDYWRQSNLYSLPLPRRVMSGRKFHRISRALHLSSLEADAANETKRGTEDYDRLCKIKPIYTEIRANCRANYHPHQDIAIDERMVASKARIGLKQYMKNKPVRWGYKLFVLADSMNGYTWDFFVYQGKLQGTSGKGLSYDSVMALIDTDLLGTGYKLFVDNFYTSPTLFRDLLQKRIWACGTIRTNRIGFPKSNVNALVSKSPRGSIRWIRKDSLLFVQWRDTRDVSMCSTLHTAHAEETIQRRVKDVKGRWELKNIPVPPAVKEYNRYMGGVDLSDALIGYYKVLHKTMRWYKTFFYHFMDIGIVNAFLLHKDHALAKGQVHMAQKTFRETLIEELAEAGSPSTSRTLPPPAPVTTHHKPVYISGHSTNGRLSCRQCHAKTPLKCSSCDVPLCFVPSRDCYNAWHDANNM